MTEAAGQKWWFDAGSVALDFAHTGGFADRRALVDTPEALGDWLRERFPGLDGEVSERELVDARALRASLARLAAASLGSTGAGEGGAAEDVDVVNLFGATPDIPPVLAGGSRQAGRSRARVGQALSAIARDAISLFGPGNAGRIRECAADDCRLIFYDESRSNNRQWCSMQRCGNRAKVRAHRARKTP